MVYNTDKPGTLTRAGQKLVQVLLDPANRNMTSLQRAEAASISLRQYHRLMADREFLDAFNARVIESLAPDVAAILARSKDVALEEGRDGFKDRELLLSMAGAYTKHQRTELTGADGAPLVVSFVKPEG